MADAIQGMTDRLDSITERIESLADVMALDMQTGFIWQYHRETTEWECGDNICEYPDLDAPKPQAEGISSSVAEYYSRLLRSLDNAPPTP